MEPDDSFISKKVGSSMPNFIQLQEMSFMVEILLLIQCVLLTIILVVILHKKDTKVIEPILEMTEKIRDRVKAYSKKAKLKPRVNDDLQAFKVENDI